MDGRELTQAFTEEFAAVMAAVLGGDPRIENVTGEALSAWSVRLSVQGSATGIASVALPARDAAVFTARVLGFDDDPPEDAITDNLLESAKQAAGAFNVKQGPDGVRLTVVEPVVTVAAPPADAEWAAVRVGDLVVRLACQAAIEQVQASARVSQVVGSQAPPRPAASRQPAAPAVPPNLDLILDIDLPLWVRFGETAMTIQTLSRLGPGTTVDLDRSPDDPVDVLVNNTIVARGEVVVVSGNYGVRVTEVVSTTDRIRSMGGLH